MDDTTPEEFPRTPQVLKDGMPLSDLKHVFGGKQITTQETQSSIQEDPDHKAAKELKKAVVDELLEMIKDGKTPPEMLVKLRQALSDLQSARSVEAILTKVHTARETLNQVKVFEAGRDAEEMDAIFSEFERIRQLQEEVNKTLNSAYEQGCISDKDKESLDKEQEAINEAQADYNAMPEDTEEQRAAKKEAAKNLADMIIRHSDHDMKVIQEAIKDAKAKGLTDLVEDLEEALKKDQEIKKSAVVQKSMLKDDKQLATGDAADLTRKVDTDAAKEEVTIKSRAEQASNSLLEMTSNIPAIPSKSFVIQDNSKDMVFQNNEQPPAPFGENEPSTYKINENGGFPEKPGSLNSRALPKNETPSTAASEEELGTMAPPFPKRPAGKGGREV